MRQPKISIIMPVYNNAGYISAAIHSVIQQTYTNWKLIIIDDASSDNTQEVIQTYAKKDTRIYLVKNNMNKGVTKSLNHAIGFAKDEFIARLDGDDVWINKDKLQKQIEFLLKHPMYGMVGCWATIINYKGEKQSSLSYPVEDEHIRKYLLIENCFIHSSVLMRKSVLESVHLYNEQYKYAQDYDLWLKIGKVSKLYNLPEYMVHYRSNPEGISQTKYQEQIAETIKIIKQNKNNYKHFFIGIFLWNTRIFISKTFRESISRKIREKLFF